MAVLQRSVTSFRRQGSSGLVWDDKFLTGVLYQIKPGEDALDHVWLGQSRSAGSTGMMDRSGSLVFVVEPVYGTKMGDAFGKPLIGDDHPPSSKVWGCGFWGFFRKSRAKARRVEDKGT